VEFKNLLYGRRDAVATITINRPDNRNALGTETVAELREALGQAKADPQIRVIVITGAGKVFCAGADLNSFRSEQPDPDRYFQRRHLADLFLEMTELGKRRLVSVSSTGMSRRRSSTPRSTRSPTSSPRRVRSACGSAWRPSTGCRT
jgi:1,4-dihydroxy-2-naphthoyl-CoA synthase